MQELAGWSSVPEVSFSIYGERGAIDILAWHGATRSLLIIELKTLLVILAELVRTMDRRVRLGRRIARERGWSPASISSWVIFVDTRTNRRHVADHRTILAPLATVDGRRMPILAERAGWAGRGAVILAGASRGHPSARQWSEGSQQGEARRVMSR